MWDEVMMMIRCREAAGAGGGAAGQLRPGRPGPARSLPPPQRRAPRRAAGREAGRRDEEALWPRRSQDPGHGGGHAAGVRQELRPEAAQVLARHPAEAVSFTQELQFIIPASLQPRVV